MTRLSRDEIVERGIIGKLRGEESHSPWIYYAKVKSGRSATQNIMNQYYNLAHLMGDLVMKHAVENEHIHIYGIHRVMRAHLRSTREDI